MKKTNIILKFPPQFSKFINDVNQIEFEGDTISDFINYLDYTYGDIKERLMDENEEKLRPYLNLFIGKKNIKSLDNLQSVIDNGEKISLLLSRAGG